MFARMISVQVEFAPILLNQAQAVLAMPTAMLALQNAIWLLADANS